MVYINMAKENSSKKERMVRHRALAKKRKPDFLRHKWFTASRLGKGRKKKQKWKKPIGRHNKLREKRKSRGRQPSIGFSSPRLVRGTISGMKPVVVRNVNDLNKLNAKKSEEVIALLASVGLKKKIEIAKKAVEIDMDFVNFNPKSFLKKAEKQLDARKKSRKEREEKMKQRIEKAKKAKEKKPGKPEAKEPKPEEKEIKEEKEIIKPKSKLLPKSLIKNEERSETKTEGEK